MVAATGVLVAAIFYILNIRETMRNRRGTFSSNARSFSCSEAWIKAYLEAGKMQWTDYEDFMKKYGWEANTELATKRYVVLARYDLMGRQYRTGLIDLDDIGAFNGFNLVWTWLKFKPIIEGTRREIGTKNAYSDFEYAAESIMNKLSDDNPDFMEKMNTQL